MISKSVNRFVFRKFLSISLQKFQANCFCAASTSAQPCLESKFSNIPSPSGDWVKSLNERQQRHLVKIGKEFALARYIDEKMPDPEMLSEEDWKNLMEFPTAVGRMKYLTFLYVKSEARKKSKLEKEMRDKESDESLEQNRIDIETSEHLVYTYYQNTIFQRILTRDIEMYKDINVAYGIQFGPKIAVDLEWFYENLNPSQRQVTAKQIQRLFFVNRSHAVPCDLVLTSWRNKARWQKLFGAFLQFLDPFNERVNRDRMIMALRTEEKPVQDLCPAHKIVYVNPMAHEELTRVDAEKVYVIPGIVDSLMDTSPKLAKFAAAKANKLGIVSRRLPLDKYVTWRKGGKTLTINQQAAILLDVFQHGNWEKSIKFRVPPRKWKEEDPEVAAQAAAVRKRDKKRYQYLASTVSRLVA